MNVFLTYSQRALPLLRTVAQSWTRNGWTVRLLLPGAKRPKRALIIDPRIVNMGLTPRHPKSARRVAHFGKKGWREARLVKFPDMESYLHAEKPGTS